MSLRRFWRPRSGWRWTTRGWLWFQGSESFQLQEMLFVKMPDCVSGDESQASRQYIEQQLAGHAGSKECQEAIGAVKCVAHKAANRHVEQIQRVAVFSECAHDGR